MMDSGYKIADFFDSIPGIFEGVRNYISEVLTIPSCEEQRIRGLIVQSWNSLKLWSQVCLAISASETRYWLKYIIASLFHLLKLTNYCIQAGRIVGERVDLLEVKDNVSYTKSIFESNSSKLHREAPLLEAEDLRLLQETVLPGLDALTQALEDLLQSEEPEPSNPNEITGQQHTVASSEEEKLSNEVPG